MKRTILIGTMALMTGSLLAAESSPKDDVSNAVKKLAGGSYAFTITTTNAGGGFGGGGGGGGRGGGMNAPMEGKVSKDGIAYSVRVMNGTTNEAVAKGAKRAIKTQDGWQTTEEMMNAGGGGGGGFGGGGMGMFAMMGLVVPASQAEELVGKAKAIKLADGVYSADLTEDGAKSLASPFPGFGGGGGGPEISGAKGSVKFWVKDGVLSKYELHTQGSMDFGGNEMTIDRTSTVEIKDAGKTDVTIPEDAKKKVL
jgi:hypothetical protein